MKRTPDRLSEGRGSANSIAPKKMPNNAQLNTIRTLPGEMFYFFIAFSKLIMDEISIQEGVVKIE